MRFLGFAIGSGDGWADDIHPKRKASDWRIARKLSAKFIQVYAFARLFQGFSAGDGGGGLSL